MSITKEVALSLLFTSTSIPPVERHKPLRTVRYSDQDWTISMDTADNSICFETYDHPIGTEPENLNKPYYDSYEFYLTDELVYSE